MKKIYYLMIAGLLLTQSADASINLSDYANKISLGALYAYSNALSNSPFNILVATIGGLHCAKNLGTSIYDRYRSKSATNSTVNTSTPQSTKSNKSTFLLNNTIYKNSFRIPFLLVVGALANNYFQWIS